MYQTMSLPLYSGSFEEYHGWGDLRAELSSSGMRRHGGYLER